MSVNFDSTVDMGTSPPRPVLSAASPPAIRGTKIGVSTSNAGSGTTNNRSGLRSNAIDSSSSLPSTSAAAAAANTAGVSTTTINSYHRAISPPTPAPSPQPEIRNTFQDSQPISSSQRNTSSLSDKSIPLLQQLKQQFSIMQFKDREAFLSSLVEVCSARELAYLSSIISPRLKVNFLSALPIEVSLQIISYMDLKSLASASGVSRFWRSLVNDEHTWKVMCDKYKFRQYAVQPNTSQEMLDIEAGDRSFQSIDPIDGMSSSGSDAHGLHLPRRSSALDSSFYSNQILSSLYETYIARGLDAASALSELKALHTLFLTKRAREMNVEERGRQLQALQNDGAFSHLIQDRTALERVGALSMSQEDKQFYQALEEFVLEKRDTSSITAEDDGNNAGWLSTGPSSNRILAGLPQTPNVSAAPERTNSIMSSMPSLSMSRGLVSPTSRLGSMTTGLLNSFWDRSGNTSENGHPPSAGDHGHSIEGHADADTSMQQSDERDNAFNEIPRGMYPPSLANRDRQILRSIPIRASSHSEARGSNALGFNLGCSSYNSNAGPAISNKRFASSGYERSSGSDPYRQLASRRSKPFSYKTHFKLAYLTEQNWLRGGRLLTQHVSSDEASGEGPVVTSLSIDEEWIVVGMANAKIHVFDARTGLFVKTLVGHSSGVWCLSLISASGQSKQSRNKGKEAIEDIMDEDSSSTTMTGLGAYPYDNDRPLYTPTPDLNLIHHDPRPTATTFSPEMPFSDINHEDRNVSSNPVLNRAPKVGERLSSWVGSNSFDENSGKASPQASRDSSRGAGLGSNFGSPCGSVQGYGNRHAIVVSGGCDRDVRVWDLSTGECKFILSGHRSTVRCLRVLEERPIAISGARDGTLRVWNVENGSHIHTLAGHQHSVRCLDVAGNMVASASYDCTCRVWNVDTGKCLHVLRGHYHQIYAVAFDGIRIATGSLDSTVRVWSAENGDCLALFQGHTSLVGQLQLTDSTLITGGSDGRVIVFSLQTYKILYQLMAHDNSVTCLQFDDRFIVTGGNDGKVKLWKFKTGEFVRVLCEQSDQVWKVSFRDDKCVVLCKRKDKTAMDVISFRPIEETI